MAWESWSALAVPGWSVSGQQGLQPGEIGLCQVAAKPTVIIGAPTPDEQLPGGWVEFHIRLVLLIVGPDQGRVTSLDRDEQVRLSVQAQPHPKVGVRVRIKLAAGHEQDLAEHTD